MARRLGPTLAAIAVLALAGCRSVGRFPTIDPSDYAYSYFNGFYSQVFQFNPAQVESSALQALGDLGFTKIERKPLDDGERRDQVLDARPSAGLRLGQAAERGDDPADDLRRPGRRRAGVADVHGARGAELRDDPPGADPDGAVARAAVQPDAAAPADAAEDGDHPRGAAARRAVPGAPAAAEVRAAPAAVPAAPGAGPEPGPFGSPNLPIPTPTPPPPAPSPGA